MLAKSVLTSPLGSIPWSRRCNTTWLRKPRWIALVGLMPGTRQQAAGADVSAKSLGDIYPPTEPFTVQGDALGESGATCLRHRDCVVRYTAGRVFSDSAKRWQCRKRNLMRAGSCQQPQQTPVVRWRCASQFMHVVSCPFAIVTPSHASHSPSHAMQYLYNMPLKPTPGSTAASSLSYCLRHHHRQHNNLHPNPFQDSSCIRQQRHPLCAERLTSGTLSLLRCALASRLQCRHMLQAVLLLLVVHLPFGVHRLQILERVHSSGVVGREGGSFEPLAQDLVAGTRGIRVEVGVEDAALDLEKLEGAVSW